MTPAAVPALEVNAFVEAYEAAQLRAGAAELADFLPLAVDEGRWGGKLYGLNVLFGGIQSGFWYATPGPRLSSGARSSSSRTISVSP